MKANDTLVIKKIGSEQIRRTIKEKHYSIIKEFGLVYLDHVSPNSPSAIGIVAFIVPCLIGIVSKGKSFRKFTTLTSMPQTTQN